MAISVMTPQRAVRVAERGPRTEAQRQQAIKSLRRFAKHLPDHEMAKIARRSAKKLADLLPLTS